MILYTLTSCGKCTATKKLLESKNIDFIIVKEIEEVKSISDSIGKTDLPFLEVDGKFYTGSEAVRYAKSL